MSYFKVPYKVDWLNLAVIADSSVSVLADCLVSDVESVFDANRQQSEKGFHNYEIRYPIGFFRGKNFSHVANVSYGGNTQSKLGDHVQLSISGADADTYYRSSEMVHLSAYIQRLDLAYDVLADYDGLIARLKALPELKRLKWSVTSSTENDITCTTTYIGSRQSSFFVRIYEKGKQVGGDPAWVRVEFEIKPTKTSAEFAVWCYEQYTKNPETILTRCKFTHAILSDLFLDDIPSYTPRMENRLPDTVRSFKHMIEQYSAVLSGLNELYDISDVLTLAQKIHRLKQSDSKEIRESVPDEIEQYLLSVKRSTPV